MTLRPPVVLDSESRTDGLMDWVDKTPKTEAMIADSKSWLITNMGLSEEAAQRLLIKS